MFQLFPSGSFAPPSGGPQARLSQHAADRYAVLNALGAVKTRRTPMPKIRAQRVTS